MKRMDALESMLKSRDARIVELEGNLKAVSERAANYVPPVQTTTKTVVVVSEPSLQDAALSRFETVFGTKAKLAAFAPGRVNLIGEHTDYTGGFVLPMALEKKTVMVGNGEIVDDIAENSECEILSFGMQKSEKFDADPEFLAPDANSWTNYVRGVMKQYSNDLPKGKKFQIKAVYNSDVPLGSGLSSSAALEVWGVGFGFWFWLCF
jgi:galactokinase